MVSLLRAGIVLLTGSAAFAQVPLDLNIGLPVFPGLDPSALPATATGGNQAEPHIFRDPVDAARLLAVFQDGRFADGGAVSNGFAVTTDGGLSWRRETLPGLTTATGGIYNRATDPVAGIDRQGRLYANSLTSRQGTFDLADVVMQISDDDGLTWTTPILVHRGNATVGPDKNWMALNLNEDAATAGRILVTWSDFEIVNGQQLSIRLKRSYSDDRGLTWSSPADLAPAFLNQTFYQGTQPLYPRGDWCVVVYHRFTNVQSNLDGALEVAVSANGGTSFQPTPEVILPFYRLFSDGQIRNGPFLPSASVSTETGDVHVVVGARPTANSTAPDLLYARSRAIYADNDVAWNWQPFVALPVDPEFDVRYTPTVTVDPSGQDVAVFYYGRVNGVTQANLRLVPRVVQSSDGGQTWTTPQSLTTGPIDPTQATLTSRGYMLGDYYGFAGPTTEDSAAVVVWMRDRGNDLDPVISRVAPQSLPRWSAWQAVRLGSGLMANGPSDDPDADGVPNLLEATLGTSPLTVSPLPTVSSDLVLPRAGLDLNAQLQTGEIWDTELTFLDEPLNLQQAGDWSRGYPAVPRWYLSVLLEEGGPTTQQVLSDAGFPWRVLEAGGGDWWYSPWFGWIFAREHPWLYQQGLGWLLRGSGDAAGIWLYDASLGWWWTQESVFPYLFRQTTGEWLYYLEASGTDRWFYNAQTATWAQL